MDYQNKQLELIEHIEESFKSGQSPSTVVDPISDYANDDRMCLTSVVFIPNELEQKIVEQIINPLKTADPRQYFYIPGSFHITINNIRTIEKPPLFNDIDIEKAKEVFGRVIKKYKPFTFELKRLFELPTSLALAAFSNETLANIALDLRAELKKASVADNKTYASSNVVIGNTTISRYTNTPNPEFHNKIKELKEIEIGSFEVKKVSLITTNAVCFPSKTTVVEEYNLA